MKITQLRQLIREEIKSVVKEESNLGLITFEQLKQACINNYNSYISGFDDAELHEPEETGIDDTNNIDELINILDGLGFNEYEAYDFIFDSILK